MGKRFDDGMTYADLLTQVPTEEDCRRYEAFRGALFREDVEKSAFAVDCDSAAAINANHVRRWLAALVSPPKVTENEDGTCTYMWMY